MAHPGSICEMRNGALSTRGPARSVSVAIGSSQLRLSDKVGGDLGCVNRRTDVRPLGFAMGIANLANSFPAGIKDTDRCARILSRCVARVHDGPSVAMLLGSGVNGEEFPSLEIRHSNLS